MAEPNKAKIQEILASNLDPAEKLRLIVEEQRIVDKENVREAVAMLTPEEREELNRRAREGEVVVPGGTGGKSLEAQIHLAEGTQIPFFLHLQTQISATTLTHHPALLALKPGSILGRDACFYLLPEVAAPSAMSCPFFRKKFL